MITYDYYCKNCGQEVEVTKSIKDDGDIHCPECNSIMKVKIAGGNGILLNGYGWAGNKAIPAPGSKAGLNKLDKILPENKQFEV